jgi:hypothetical protein
LYIDPGLDTTRYLAALLERTPVLLLGQFFAPPAELYVITGETWSTAILIFAVVFVAALGAALVPVLRQSRTARFWAAGALISLVPAASTYPHNRQLLFTSFGAMALIAELWHQHAIELKGQSLSGLLSFSGRVGAVVLFAHLIVSPIVLPLTSCSIAFSSPLHGAIDDVGDDVGGRDAVFVTAPEYFAVRLVQLSRRVERQPLPRRWRALSFGGGDGFDFLAEACQGVAVDAGEQASFAPFDFGKGCGSAGNRQVTDCGDREAAAQGETFLLQGEVGEVAAIGG